MPVHDLKVTLWCNRLQGHTLQCGFNIVIEAYDPVRVKDC